MAVVAQTAAALRMGGFNLSSVTHEILWGVEVAELDKTTFGSGNFREWTTALKRLVIAPTAFNDYADDAADEFARNYLGTLQPFSLVPTSDTAGNMAVVGRGIVKAYDPEWSQVGELPNLGIEVGGSGATAQGFLSIDAQTTRTSTTTGTAVQAGAVASGQSVYAACHLLTFGGTITSVTFSLQSDDASNFPSATTVATGSTLTAVGGDWLSSSSVTADTWWRVVATVVGAAPSYVVAAAIAVG